jgi:hypothetical protein
LEKGFLHFVVGVSIPVVGEKIPCTHKGTYYMRVGPSTRVATEEEQSRLAQRLGGKKALQIEKHPIRSSPTRKAERDVDRSDLESSLPELHSSKDPNERERYSGDLPNRELFGEDPLYSEDPNLVVSELMDQVSRMQAKITKLEVRSTTQDAKIARLTQELHQKDAEIRALVSQLNRVELTLQRLQQQQ